MPEHHFDVDFACKYGVLEAVIANHFYFWLKVNEANNKNYHDGKYWTFSSTKALTEIFPYASERKIRNALKHLEDVGIIVTGNYNKSSYDRTLWYAFTDLAYCILQKCKMESSNMVNGSVGNVEPIPDNITDNITDYKTDSSTATRSQKRQRIPYDEVVNMYSTICISYPKLNSLSDKRKKAIAARFRSGRTLADFEQMFRKAEASSFLKGSNKNNWSADFDWMLNDANMTKILEDKYIDKPADYGAQASQEHRSGFPGYGHGSEEIDISKNPTYGENWRDRF